MVVCVLLISFGVSLNVVEVGLMLVVLVMIRLVDVCCV